MTTDSTIFGTEGTTTPESTAPAKTKEEQTLLDALVGEKQKYKSVDELAKAYVNADEFIQKLKAENAELRKQSESAKTIDDVLSRLNRPTEERETTPSPSLTAEDIAALVEKTVTGRETQRTREANLLKADKLMKDKFGEKAMEKFASKATTEELKKVYMDLASQDPDTFITLFFEQTSARAGVDSGTQNTTMPVGQGGKQEWSKEWVAEVRKADPGRYWSAEFQYQLQDRVTKNPSLYGFDR